MCGRYSLFSSAERVAALFGIQRCSAPDHWVARYNIAPGGLIWTVREDGCGGTTLAPAIWGFGASDQARGGPCPINARSETVATSSIFGAAFAHRRCLVPADAFFEWRSIDPAPRRQPYAIRRRDRGLLALAAVWQECSGNATTAILTTRPNSMLRAIHDRMPLLLAESSWAVWLKPDSPPDAARRAMHAMCGETELEVFPVSRRVNNPRNDDASCLEPVTDGGGLFDTGA